MGDIYGKSVYDELVKNSELYKGLLEENIKLKELNKQMQENYNNLNDSYSEILGENEKIKEELEWYKKQYKHSMGED